MTFSKKMSLKNSMFLKIFSLLLGYALWNMFSYPYKIKTTFELPLFFYNIEKQVITQAPESIQASLYGTRTELFKIIEKGSIHYDGATLQEGSQKIRLHEQNIFLPETIRLVHYKPQEVIVTIKKELKDALSV